MPGQTGLFPSRRGSNRIFQCKGREEAGGGPHARLGWAFPVAER